MRLQQSAREAHSQQPTLANEQGNKAEVTKAELDSVSATRHKGRALRRCVRPQSRSEKVLAQESNGKEQRPGYLWGHLRENGKKHRQTSEPFGRTVRWGPRKVHQNLRHLVGKSYQFRKREWGKERAGSAPRENLTEQAIRWRFARSYSERLKAETFENPATGWEEPNGFLRRAKELILQNEGAKVGEVSYSQGEDGSHQAADQASVQSGRHPLQTWKLPKIWHHRDQGRRDQSSG